MQMQSAVWVRQNIFRTRKNAVRGHVEYNGWAKSDETHKQFWGGRPPGTWSMTPLFVFVSGCFRADVESFVCRKCCCLLRTLFSMIILLCIFRLVVNYWNKCSFSLLQTRLEKTVLDQRSRSDQLCFHATLTCDLQFRFHARHGSHTHTCKR